MNSPRRKPEAAARKAERKAPDSSVTGAVGIFKVRRVVPGVASEAAEMRRKDENRGVAIGFGH